ncbi:MAG TPA: hypothetical protein ENN50_01090 [Prosthecochloris aestuarii]|uniref:DUF5671 domain-containing protein n=1 Tax=Prosthecochloris aestuarii TaxID=1102 RepID=A0A831SMC7_PROAE|nr:hypothetical protein [Prosthecochloris aestuarii]
MEKPNNELSVFVCEALRKEISRDRIREVLLKAGWQAERADRALEEYAEIDFPLPVPKPRPFLSARETFFYLLLFVTLYISAFNFGNLLFIFIEQAFPDPAMGAMSPEWMSSRLRGAVSALVVAFPLFLYLSRKIASELQNTPAGRSSGVRRWLTYLTLFIAACIILGDVSALLFSLLGGELTVRFVLKVLVVGAIAGVIFIYYLQGLRSEEQVS